MTKKIILIILMFVLMMNLLIGVIYAAEEVQESQPEETLQEVEDEEILLDEEITNTSLNSEESLNESRKERTVVEDNRQYCLLGGLGLLVICMAFVERHKTIKIFLRILATIIIVYFLFIFMMLKDLPILIFTVIAAFLIVFVNAIIKNGLHRKAFIELNSVLIITYLAAISIYVIVKIFNISLLNEGVQRFKIFTNSANNIFAITVFVLLGIYMDLVWTFISRLDAEKDKTVDITSKEQFKNGLKIGKELIIEKFNMIFLIFTGISVLTICIGLKDGYTILELIKLDEIFLMLMIVIIGSIGVVLSVPITAFFYGLLNNKKTIYKTTPENRIDGKRSLKL